MCPGACGEQQRLGCKGRDWLPPRPDVAEYRQGFALLSGWGGVDMDRLWGGLQRLRAEAGLGCCLLLLEPLLAIPVMVTRFRSG